MKKAISILHVSDLHRSKENALTNNALMSSLINDQENYTQFDDYIIKSPDIIIVSGDVIRGSTNMAQSEIETADQYVEAEEFLVELANRFLSGDKEKIIIIPGNHDINWKSSVQSMEKIDVPDNLKGQYIKNVVNGTADVRWSWRDFSFYQISDKAEYNNRLAPFCEFYHRFYDCKRTYDINPEKQYDIYDYPELNVVIVAFNSCYNNDHLRFVGDIHPACIADANIEIKKFKKKGRLILGTWHHNTKGLPYEDNYMDTGKLKNFIDSGIAVGFHGHQHKTELIQDYNNVVQQKRIVVFSAGTLCGGPNELPTGNNRQYNIVEIDWDDDADNITVTLNVREKTNTSTFENPIWVPGRIDSNLISRYSVDIPKPNKPDNNLLLLELEQLIRENRFEKAKKMIKVLDINDAYVRKYIAEYLVKSDDNEFAIEIFFTPKTEEEAVIVLSALISINNTKMSKKFLDNFQFLESNSIKTLVKTLEAISK
jgi:predicted phosphodiesterase